MAVIGELAVNVVARTSGLTNGMNRARKDMGLLSSAILGVRGSLLGLGAAFAAFRGISFIAQATAESEQLRAGFEVLTGSVEKGTKVYGELRDLAAGTPLRLTGISKAARTLMLFGESAESVTDTIRMLGDVSGGDQTNLSFMSRAFGQIQSLGRLQAQDLMQLVNAGWNPLNEIMERTGETMEQVRERMKDGKVSADEVRQALEMATGSGGRFNGLMQRMSKTLAGRWSTLKDNIEQVAIAFGEELMPLFEAMLGYVTEIVQWFKDLSPEVKANIVWFAELLAAIGAITATVWVVVSAMRVWAAVLAGIAAAKAFIAGLDGNWAGIAIGTAAAAAATGGLLMLYNDMEKKARLKNMQEKEAADELERQQAAAEALVKTGGLPNKTVALSKPNFGTGGMAGDRGKPIIVRDDGTTEVVEGLETITEEMKKTNRILMRSNAVTLGLMGGL